MGTASSLLGSLKDKKFSNSVDVAKSSKDNSMSCGYTIEEEIGRGAFSTVYRITDNKSNVKLAGKRIIRSLLSLDDFLSVKSEVGILSSLRHPNIVKLHDYIETKNELWIILDLADGGDVYDRIAKKGYYTELEARNMAKMLLETVDYIHSSGIVHRDLKPENLLLISNTSDVVIKICDFGFADKVADLIFPYQDVCGTPNFVAPEMIRRQKYKTKPDIWALGVIFYILLAGYPPFYSKNERALFRKIKIGKYVFHPEFWTDISHDAKDFITKMLCVEIDKRWTAKQLLDHPWIKMDENEFSSRNLILSQEVLRQMRVRRGGANEWKPCHLLIYDTEFDS